MDRDARRLEERISEERGRPARIVVWAHDSHLGDARTIEMVERGELNVGHFRTRLSEQFDAVIHVDETTALRPLEVSQCSTAGEPPESFPR